MKDPKFVHLRVHTAYSLAEGAIMLPTLIHKLHDMGVPAVAVTDSSNMFGGKAFPNMLLMKALNRLWDVSFCCEMRILTI